MARKSKGLGTAGLALLAGDKSETEPGTALPGDSNRNHQATATDGPAAGGSPTPSRRARSGGIIDALRREDTTGQVVMRIPLEDVAEHPDNPRESLGDLAALAASLKELGQLQPATVISRDDFLAAHPEWPAVARPWVVVIGHRRRAGLEMAGIGYIEAVQRHGGTKVDDHLTMYAENVHRAGLTALEEARLFSILVENDQLGQRQIAAKLGISQSHVSKRLALLKLPQQVQDAIARDQISVAEALALTGVPSDDQLQVWNRAQRDGLTIAAVVKQVERVRANQAAVDKARKAAQKQGVEIVEDPSRQWGSRSADHRLYDEDDIEKAKEAGDLLAHPTSAGVTYYSATAVPVAPRPPSPDHQDEKRERDKARKARTAAAGELALKQPTPKEAAEAVVDHILFGGGIYAETLKLAHKWLGDRVGTPDDDAYRWRDSLAGADIAVRRWVAWAMSLAYAELRARDTYSPWGPRERDYLNQLFIAVGYQPTPWEQARLDRIKETDR